MHSRPEICHAVGFHSNPKIKHISFRAHVAADLTELLISGIRWQIIDWNENLKGGRSPGTGLGGGCFSIFLCSTRLLPPFLDTFRAHSIAYFSHLLSPRLEINRAPPPLKKLQSV